MSSVLLETSKSDLLYHLNVSTPHRWQGECLDPDKTVTSLVWTTQVKIKSLPCLKQILEQHERTSVPIKISVTPGQDIMKEAFRRRNNINKGD